MLAAATENPSGLVLLASAATGLATYLVARRRASGGVETSEASDLWDAMREFQNRQNAEILRLQQSESACTRRCEELAVRLDEVQGAHRDLLRKHDALVRRVERVARLHPDLGLGIEPAA